LLLAVDYVELSKNVGLTLLGVFAFFVGLTYVTVNVLIPQASRQVEQEIKALDPALWDEYLLKLKPGETMDQRPDLIQELGNKVLELQEKQFQLLNRNQSSDMSSTDNQVSEASKEPRSVLDVEILSKNPWEDE
jgi:Na+/phosphate symporter